MTENIKLSGERADFRRREIIEKNLKELKRRRELGEIDKENYPLMEIFYINDDDYENRPLTREDLGKKALVLTAKEFYQLAYIVILLPDGQELELFAKDYSSNPDDLNEVLVIFPEDLGNTEK